MQTLGPIPDLDYYDQRSILLPRALTPLDAWNAMIGDPLPFLGLAFRIRDAISSLFGVRRIGGFSRRQRSAVKAGDRLDFFLVEEVADDRLVLTERDRHLDVMTTISTEDRRLTITSSVITHNGFGRAYMVPVGPAHKLIVTTMLRRLKRRLERDPAAG